MGGANCRFHSPVITGSFNYADDQESVKLHLLLDWMQWRGKCRQDGFYFKNSFHLTHFVHLENTRWKLELEQVCIYMALVTVPILTVQLFWFWPAIASKSGRSACLLRWIGRWLSVFYCLSGCRCLCRGCPAISPSWASVSLVACDLVQCFWVCFFFFPLEKNQLLSVFLRIWQWNDLLLMQVILRTKEVILVTRSLAARHSCLPQSRVPSS